MDVQSFIDENIKEIKDTVGEKKAIVALSGGVDSSATAVLAHRAIGDQLISVFIDDGLMRENEPETVKDIFEGLGIDLKIIDAGDEFLDALKGIEDPEEKRKAFRNTFYTTFGGLVKESGANYLLQGTIAADIVETKGGVKTQHNVLEQIGIDPETYGFGVIEPLKELYKPEVRLVGESLGLPEEIHQRMPFPGPGLATRVIGEVTPERVEIVRKATKIVEDETKELRPFQAFAVLMNDMATGVEGGERTFGNIIIVRSVESENAITAEVTKIPYEKLENMQRRITSEIPEVTRVVFDITPKPPATIEYI